MDFLVIAGCLMVAVVVLSLLIFNGRNRTGQSSKKDAWSHIPGPPIPSTVRGNLDEMLSAGSIYQYLTQLHRKYGETVHYRFFDRHFVSTYSPEGYKDLIKHFDKPALGMDFIEPVFGNRCIQYMNGEEAKLRRQRYDYFMNSEFVSMYFPSFVEIVDDMMKAWKKYPSGEQLPIYCNMFRLACKAVGITMMGDYYRDDERIEEFRKLYEVFWPMLEKNFSEGMPKEGTEERARCDKVIEDTVKIAEVLMEDRKDAKDRKFIDVVLETCLDEKSKKGDVLVYLMGGFHNSAIILTWCLYHYSKHPDVKSQIDAELREAFPKDEPITEEDLRKLPYLRQFLDENLRIHFSAPLATRASIPGTNIRGYDIPLGTYINQALSVTLMHPDLWHNPEKFDPGRFDPEQSKDRHPLTFSPFGFAGRRLCPGKRFFYVEALVYLSTIFRNFDIEVMVDGEVDITYGFLTRPTNELWMKIKSKHGL